MPPRAPNSEPLTEPAAPAEPAVTTAPRRVASRYEDPLEAVWLAAAERIGLAVVRSADTYASTDGRGALLLSDAAGMDPDDCLAQMIFHELCHSLVMGEESFSWVDWGLDNETSGAERVGRDDFLEHACLRLQAALLEPLGLRQVLAPTTDFRAYYDALPRDAFAPRAALEGEERRRDAESIVRARAALARREQRPWGPHLGVALTATAAIVEAAHAAGSRASVLGLAEPRARLHRVGLPLHPSASASAETRARESPGPCSECGWFEPADAELGACVQADRAATSRDAAPCERWEPRLDCRTCGACCREAYDTVEADAEFVARGRYLPLLRPHGAGFDLARRGSRCVALAGGLDLDAHVPGITGSASCGAARAPERRSRPHIMPGDAPFSCTIYPDRPRCCREFERGAESCLEARRSVGLSR